MFNNGRVIPTPIEAITPTTYARRSHLEAYLKTLYITGEVVGISFTYLLQLDGAVVVIPYNPER